MTALVTDPRCLDHDPGAGHPESPRRYAAALDALKKSGLHARLKLLEPRALKTEDLLLVHDAAYVKLAEAEIRAGAEQLSTGDTSVGPKSWQAALSAAGCTLAAVDAVMEGKVVNAFSLHRPPGHHATPSRGMGFCVLNNVALAARHAQKRYGVQRVLIADWDVHHGNGTQDCFYEDASVFLCRPRHPPGYPGPGARNEWGRGPGRGPTRNPPRPAGSGRREIFAAFEKKLVPPMDAFQP